MKCIFILNFRNIASDYFEITFCITWNYWSWFLVSFEFFHA